MLFIIRYIEENRDEVMANFERNMKRINRGNPPHLQAKLDAGHERFLALARERRAATQNRPDDTRLLLPPGRQLLRTDENF